MRMARIAGKNTSKFRSISGTSPILVHAETYYISSVKSESSGKVRRSSKNHQKITIASKTLSEDCDTPVSRSLFRGTGLATCHNLVRIKF